MTVIESPYGNYFIHDTLASNLTIARNAIKKDWDMIICVDGPEGSGKSVLTMQMAYFVDSTFDVDRVAFNEREFKQAVLHAKPFQAIIYDEAYTGLSSRAAMSYVNRTLVQMLAEIRQRNLFIFVVMPSFFDLDKYVALHRSRALIHVYVEENFQRGQFSFYSMEKKKLLYIEGKKFYNYRKPYPDFIGNFPSHYPINETEYKKRKRDSLMKRESARIESDLIREMQDAMFARLAKLDPGVMPHKFRILALGIPESTYWYKLRQYNEGKLDNLEVSLAK